MDITEHLKRIEKKVDHIIEITKSDTSNDIEKNKNSNQLYFSWYLDLVAPQNI